ncbi:MAG: glutaredoxin family protein [Gammaproteobacteria bacterium]|jgi:glutaredoxin
MIAIPCLLLLALSRPAAAEIYSWVDTDGHTQFADRAPPGADATQVELRTANTIKSVSVATLPERDAPTSTIILYSASWCGVCKQARAYFQRQGISYREFDIERTARGREDFRKLGGTGVPIILIGRQRMNGFSIGRFEELYKG